MYFLLFYQVTVRTSRADGDKGQDYLSITVAVPFGAFNRKIKDGPLLHLSH